MSAFDLTNQSMQRTEPETDYITPRMKLRDETFVFVDGKWVNEIYCQPPFASHLKLFSGKAQKEWSIWEENRALWEENQILRIKTRMLWEENQALQRLQSQNEVVQVIYPDAIQQSLQKPFPFIQEMNVGFLVSPGNKALQEVQEKNTVFEDFQQENETVPMICKDLEVITVHEERNDTSSDLQEDTAAIAAVEEGNPSSGPQHEPEAKKKITTPAPDNIKSAPSTQGESEILQALHDLYKVLHVFLKVNRVLEEKESCHILYDVNRSFQEDYNKLKLQLNAVKNTMSDITAQMEMLEKELVAITFPTYEEAGQKLTAEIQLG